jgi:uncharacterized protein (TIGR02271 family)
MSFTNPTSLRGQQLLDTTGDSIGTIEEIYLDTQTDRPEWALVDGNFVPIADAQPHGEHVHVPFEKGRVKSSPAVSGGAELSQAEEAELYRHYGLGGRFEGGVGHDTSGPTTDNAMTRSEEEVAIGKRQVETGRARLRKYVVEDTVSETVPLAREQVRIEREPITDANVGQALDGPAISEEEHEVVLHAEEPVVEKRIVPKERVRLDTDVEQTQAQVTETVAKEEIAIEGDGQTRERF